MSKSSNSTQINAVETQPLLGVEPERQAIIANASKQYGILAFFRNLFPKIETSSPRFRYVPALACLVLFLSEAEWCFKQVAQFRAIEALYCIEYYQQHDPSIAKLGRGIPENKCKADTIQQNVANMIAMISFMRMLSASLGTLYVGWVADRFGRKIVLVMHRINVFIYVSWVVFIYLSYPLLPIWTIWLGGMVAFFGGNFDVLVSVLFSSFSDIVPDPVQRSKLFYLTNGTQYAAQLFIPMLGGLLTNLDGKGGTPQVALLTSTCLAFSIVVLIILIFPETLEKKDRPIKNSEEDEEAPEQNNLKTKIKAASSGFAKLLDGIGVLNMALICLSLFFVSVGNKSIDWFGIIQYPVIRLHWTFSQASTIISLQAAITLLNFTLLVPRYTTLGANYGLTSATISMMIMLWSCMLFLAGSICIGFAANNVVFLLGAFIYTLGTGFTIATQAFIASLIDKARIARVLSMISIVITLGKLTASAIFPTLLSIGLGSGIEVLKGLPIFASGVLFVLAAVQLGLLGAINKRVDKKQDNEEDVAEQRDVDADNHEG